MNAKEAATDKPRIILHPPFDLPRCFPAGHQQIDTLRAQCGKYLVLRSPSHHRPSASTTTSSSLEYCKNFIETSQAHLSTYCLINQVKSKSTMHGTDCPKCGASGQSDKTCSSCGAVSFSFLPLPRRRTQLTL